MSDSPQDPTQARERLAPEALSLVLQGVHYDWWQQQVLPRFEAEVPDLVKESAFRFSLAGFTAGYSFGYEKGREETTT